MPSLFHDKKGKYRVQWTHDGRRKSRTFATEKEAKLFSLKLETGEIDLAQATSPTFKEFSERWLRDYCQIEKAESQWKEDRSVISIHLLPALSDKRLVDLTKGDLVRLKTELSRKESAKTKKLLSPKTVNNILALAKKMLNTAVDMELLVANPWQSVRPIRAQEGEFQFWTPAERDQFLGAIRLVNEEFARLVCVACHTGLRMGELAGLRRGDIDFDARIVYVRAQYSMKLKKRLATTKGKKVGQVPLNAVALSALSHCMDFGPSESVFSLGMFHNAQRQLTKYAARAKVKRIRFHDLRHSFASCLAMAGVDLMVIQKLMRHKSYQMTLRYAHLHPDHLTGATDALVHAKCTRRSLQPSQSAQTLEQWWAHRDLNPGHAGYENVA